MQVFAARQTPPDAVSSVLLRAGRTFEREMRESAAVAGARASRAYSTSSSSMWPSPEAVDFVAGHAAAVRAMAAAAWRERREPGLTAARTTIAIEAGPHMVRPR